MDEIQCEHFSERTAQPAEQKVPHSQIDVTLTGQYTGEELSRAMAGFKKHCFSVRLELHEISSENDARGSVCVEPD